MDSKIGLINTYSTLNIGDSAIYSAFAGMLPDARVFAQFQDSQTEYTPGIQVVEALPRCNAYISVGGDIFNNAREGLVTKAFLLNLRQLWRSPKHTLVFGQSIPRSCHGLSFQTLAFCFRRLAAVCVRDVESHKRLTQAGVSARLSYDVAFSLSLGEAAKQEAVQTFQSLDILPDTAVLISLRGFDSMYTQDNTQFQRHLVTLCQTLIHRGHQPVLLLQAKAYGADHDLAIAQTIVQQVPAAKIFDPFVGEYRCANWERVMAALAICRFSVAVRYHTAVLSLASGRVPFNLYYSNKGRDLTQRLQIPGCSLEGFAPEAQVAAMEKTADQTFDHAPIRQQVQQDFQDCYQQAIA
jgi:polysaccharide pyruvyl transferase WcaK-like protein